MKTYYVITDFILPMAAENGFSYIKGELFSSETPAVAKVPTEVYKKLVDDYLSWKELYYEVLGGVGYFSFRNLKKTRKSFFFGEEGFIYREFYREAIPPDKLVITYPVYEWVIGTSEADCEIERG